jgi:hypothetical protein
MEKIPFRKPLIVPLRKWNGNPERPILAELRLSNHSTTVHHQF